MLLVQLAMRRTGVRREELDHPLWKRFYFCLIVVNLGVGTFMFAKHLWVIMIIYLLIGVCQAPT